MWLSNGAVSTARCIVVHSSVIGIGRVVMIGMVNGGNVIGGGVVKLLVAVTGEGSAIAVLSVMKLKATRAERKIDFMLARRYLVER